MRKEDFPPGYVPTPEALAALERSEQSRIEHELRPFDELPERTTEAAAYRSCWHWLIAQPGFPSAEYTPLAAGAAIQTQHDRWPWRVTGSNLCLVAVIRQAVEDSSEKTLANLLERTPAFQSLLAWLKEPPDHEADRLSCSTRAEMLTNDGLRSALALAGLPTTPDAAEHAFLRAFGWPAQAWLADPGVEETRQVGNLYVQGRMLDPRQVDGQTFIGCPAYPARGCTVTTFCLAPVPELERKPQFPPPEARVTLHRIEGSGPQLSRDELTRAVARVIKAHATWWRAHDLDTRRLNRRGGSDPTLDALMDLYRQGAIAENEVEDRAVSIEKPITADDLRRLQDRVRKRLARAKLRP